MLADAPKAIRTLLLPLAVYLIWTATTYVFEGRIHQMLHFDPVERAAYVVIANVIVGTIIAAWALRRALPVKSLLNHYIHHILFIALSLIHI